MCDGVRSAATVARRLILRRYRTSFDRWSIRGASPKRAGRRRTEHILDPEMNDGSWYQRLVAVDYAREQKLSSRCDCQPGRRAPSAHGTESAVIGGDRDRNENCYGPFDNGLLY